MKGSEGINLFAPTTSEVSRPPSRRLWGHERRSPWPRADFCSSIRKRSSKIARAYFRRPAWPHRTRSVAVQHPQGRHQDALRMLLAHRSSTPALPDHFPTALTVQIAPAQRDARPGGSAPRHAQGQRRLSRSVSGRATGAAVPRRPSSRSGDKAAGHPPAPPARQLRAPVRACRAGAAASPHPSVRHPWHPAACPRDRHAGNEVGHCPGSTP